MGRIRVADAVPVLVLALASAIPSITRAAAPEAVQVGRYSTVAPVPRAAQLDPLQAVVMITFPDQVSTVGKALYYLLRRTGYRFAPPEATDPASAVLMSQPLPAVHHQLGPITVSRALTTLAGPAWYLVIDPAHRLVSFELVRHHAGRASEGNAYGAGR